LSIARGARLHCGGRTNVSLFDGEPLTDEDILNRKKASYGHPSVTIKDDKGRAIRRQPYHVDLGKGPDGFQCKDCESLGYVGGTKKYYKCGLWPITYGNATQIGCRDLACRNFKPTVEAVKRLQHGARPD